MRIRGVDFLESLIRCEPGLHTGIYFRGGNPNVCFRVGRVCSRAAISLSEKFPVATRGVFFESATSELATTRALSRLSSHAKSLLSEGHATSTRAWPQSSSKSHPAGVPM